MHSVALESFEQIAAPILPQLATASENPWARLQLPLRDLLTSGGDERLTPEVGAVLNKYGCAPEPVSGIGEYSSSTASTISAFGWTQAKNARADLLGAERDRPFDEVFDDRLEDLRHRLRNMLRLPAGTDIVFTPSGTDTVLCATFLAEALHGSRLTRIVPLAEETGNGVVVATQGRHFSFKSALGATVRKSEQIWGTAEPSAYACVSGRNELGRPLSERDRDTAVTNAVSQAVLSGNNVLLLAMDCSKTGLSMPSFQCLQHISSRWPGQVQIVVDACQMRLSRTKLCQYLNLNFPVMITGSKFFTGPAFCGALLVPPMMASFVRMIQPNPGGLLHYSGRFSWPVTWTGIRQRLNRTPNFGEWLRWEATAAEMQRFFAVPRDLRSAALHQFARMTLSFIDSSDALRHVYVDPREPSEASDEGMSAQTIFPFVLCPEGKPLSFALTRNLYELLNRQIAEAVERNSARNRADHLGQPVAIHGPEQNTIGAMRISVGARLIAQAWDPHDQASFARRIRSSIEGFAEALAHTAQLARGCVD